MNSGSSIMSRILTAALLLLLAAWALNAAIGLVTAVLPAILGTGAAALLGFAGYWWWRRRSGW